MGDFIHRVRTIECERWYGWYLTRFRRVFSKKKGEKEGSKKYKLLILIYTRLDMILDRRERVKIRDANEQTCYWTKRIYISRFPCEHIFKSIRRRSANFRKLDDTWNRIVSSRRLDNLLFLRERCLQLVDSVREMRHFGVHLSHQIVQPVHAVQYLNALRVRIVPNLKRPAHGGHLQHKEHKS